MPEHARTWSRAPTWATCRARTWASAAGILALMSRSWIPLLMLMSISACADDRGGAGSDPGDSSDGAEQTESGPGETGEPSESESESDTDDPTDDPTEDPTEDTEDTDDPGELPAGCNQPALHPGTHKNQTGDVNGTARSYELFVPVTYRPDNPSALVLNFHGLLGNPAQQADWSQFNQSAQLRGMLVAYPAGIGNSFNAGACCGEANSQGVDDIGFARALVDKLLAEHCIDPRRVYVTGMSHGGHLAHPLESDAADAFAAAASVTGVMG